MKRDDFLEEIQQVSELLFQTYMPEIKRKSQGKDADYLAVEAFGCASGTIARYFWEHYLAKPNEAQRAEVGK